ncbi:MAG: hypothetical protein WDZ74_00905 [Candidatus Paceibacterota bacterium]
MSDVWASEHAECLEELIFFLAADPAHILEDEREVVFSELRKSNRTLSNYQTKVLSTKERHFISFGIITIRCIQSVRIQQSVSRSPRKKKFLIKKSKLRQVSKGGYLYYVLRDHKSLQGEVCILLNEIRTFLRDP